MAKNFLKFAWGFGALLILGLAIFYGIQYYQYRQNPQFQAQKQFEELERLYQEDTYGGFTPEETLQLFIEALKTGDVELASRYFLVEEQEKWEDKLKEIKGRGKIDDMILDLQKTKLTIRDETAFFTLVDNNNIAIAELVMHKNSLNNRWKITEL